MRRRALIYRDQKGRWRWNLRDYFNGKITAASSESFVRRDQAIKSLAAETGIDLTSRVTWRKKWRRLDVTFQPGIRAFTMRGASFQ